MKPALNQSPETSVVYGFLPVKTLFGTLAEYAPPPIGAHPERGSAPVMTALFFSRERYVILASSVPENAGSTSSR